MKRRDFLKTAVAATALPLFATEEKIKFLHITDSHMDLHDPQSVEAIKAMVRNINFKFNNIDFVLFGGDNFNNNINGNEDAVVFKKIISGLTMPAYCVRGNKEANPKGDQQIDLQKFLELFTTPNMLVVGKNWMVMHNGFMILGLDSCIDHHNNGRFDKETIAFAKKMLELGKPTIMLSHHPYLNFWGSTNPDNIYKYVLNNTEEVQKELFGYPNLLLTLTGHIHIDDTKSRIGHVRCITTRAFKNSLGGNKYPMRLITIEGKKIEEKLVHI